MVIASTLHFSVSRVESGRSALKDGAFGSSNRHSCLRSTPNMSNFLDVTHIQAKSSVPLYVRLADGSRPSVQKNVWTWLWVYGSAIPNNAFTAFDTTTSATVPLVVDCRFNLLSPTRFYLRGFLNGLEVLSSPTVVNPQGSGSGTVRISDLAVKYPLPCPIAYRGSFTWVLGDERDEIWVTGTNPSPLELYIFKAPTGTAMSLWPSYGISVNLLRAYLAIFDNRKRIWTESEARRALVQSVYDGAFLYDNAYGASRYTTSVLGVTYRLELYFQDFNGSATV
ncbi:hypothetical protein JAAARDRAFT_485561 [Jaapia argillacea MUCL 33604]|uniref:Uncharacterized protein n=1 Tax=Jaapia argillacea MUCL 33604 TaxID=933084 RepID=A0A067PBC1_9AGAM|nr:hypothetical protein JAAARDRAFT_485561 [Jaapia argillacea MUCL 33604]